MAHTNLLSLFSLLKGHLRESYNRNYYDDYYYYEFSQIAGKCSSNHIFFVGVLEFWACVFSLVTISKEK